VWPRRQRAETRAVTSKSFDELLAGEREPGSQLRILFEHLVLTNDNMPDSYEDAGTLKKLTRGQQLLVRVAIFDDQVRDGGVAQFLDSHDDLMLDIADDLEFLGSALLLAYYTRLLKMLLGKGRLLLKAESWSDSDGILPPSDPDERTDPTDWFDKAYFGVPDSDDSPPRNTYLGDRVAADVVAYVRKHRGEFIL